MSNAEEFVVVRVQWTGDCNQSIPSDSGFGCYIGLDEWTGAIFPVGCEQSDITLKT